MKNKNVLYLTQAAMIAALYVVLTMIANALGIARATFRFASRKPSPSFPF